MNQFSNATKAGTINSSTGEFVPYDSASATHPSTFVCDSLKMLFGCNVDGLTCTLTLYGEMKFAPLAPPYNPDEMYEWDLADPTVFLTKAAMVRLVRYQPGNWDTADPQKQPEHYRSTDQTRNVGYSTDPISVRWTESAFAGWMTTPGMVSMVEEKEDGTKVYHSVALDGSAVMLCYDLDIPDIPFANDGHFYGFPCAQDVPIPSAYDGGIWTMNDKFYGFPYIRSSGIAPPYQGGFSDLYRGRMPVKRAYLGRRIVNRVYRGKVLVFEKG